VASGSSGSNQRKVEVVIGDTIGPFVIVARVPSRLSRWRVRCHCGNTKEIYQHHLLKTRAGRTCRGCWVRKVSAGLSKDLERAVCFARENGVTAQELAAGMGVTIVRASELLRRLAQEKQMTRRREKRLSWNTAYVYRLGRSEDDVGDGGNDVGEPVGMRE
jgi:hypothetical protein